MTDLTAEAPAAPAARRGFNLASLVLLLGVLAVAAVFGVALLRQNQTQPESGAAPDFTLITLDGGQVRLSALTGRVVVINFWASWCGPCRDEAPALEAIWRQYQERGVVVVGVAYTDTERGARAFLAEFGITYPNGLDIGTEISERYNIIGVPETFIIDAEGNVARFFKQPLTQDQLAAALDEVLERPA